MAYTAYRTWTTGEIVTAAIMNTDHRDNGLACVVAIVTTAGDIVYATALNALARLGLGASGQVLRVNSGATAPAWAAFTATASLTGQTYTPTARTVWEDAASVNITPGLATGFIIVFVQARHNGDDGGSLRAGVGTSYGASIGMSGGGSPASATAVYIFANSSASAQAVKASVNLNAGTGADNFIDISINAFWLPS